MIKATIRQQVIGAEAAKQQIIAIAGAACAPVDIYFNGSFVKEAKSGSQFRICLVNSEGAEVGEIIDEISSTNQQASLEQDNEFEIVG